MNEAWIHKYILLAFRINRLVERIYEKPFIEDYYGPGIWKERVEKEAEVDAPDLVRQAINLFDYLPIQGFTERRIIYLEKHLKAMETLCRKLCGETFSLEQEARDCLDIHLMWTPETQFEEAHALYETVLPGTGSLAERYAVYKRAIAFPQEHTNLLSHFIKQAFAEARWGTSNLIELSDGEGIDIHILPEDEYETASYYKGYYRTNIHINLETIVNQFPHLFDQLICHEGYPGHHTEHSLKDRELVQKREYLEQTLNLALCPQCVISEGIATMAHEIILPEGYAERWVAEQVYHPLQKEVDPIALLRMRQASEMIGGIWNNVVMMLAEGRPEKEVAQYLARYTFSQQSDQLVASLQNPMDRLNTLIYGYGKQLMQPWLQWPDRRTNFLRFLREQFVPSQLEKKWLPAPE